MYSLLTYLLTYVYRAVRSDRYHWRQASSSQPVCVCVCVLIDYV